MLIKCELLKIKRQYHLFSIVIIGFLVVCFQSYIGYKETSIPSSALYVTGLDIFSSLIFPVMITILVSLSFYHDVENMGIQLFILKGISIRKIFYSKWIAYVIAMIIYFLLAFSITVFFMVLRGINIIDIFYNTFTYLIYSILSIILLVNLSFILYGVLKNYFIPILIGVIASIIGVINLGDWVNMLNPWAYLNNLSSTKSIGWEYFATIIISTLISCFTMLMVIKIYCESKDHES
ncbi:ABC transporter permease [Clostridium perfringens]|uniref:Putative membrane protein n=1 Tax=Clostridium perfringens D str. JGS1721 TaxID=488537 RepID=B1V0D4_CLOPF|nr:ABC transporter permease [Clostridium perfringens]EDT72742.1 putative membrane protein [Clostridium perfringens D str. JGS1721]MDU2688360.1 ABC transporter permease [Paeniclostridium sordellii]NGT56961.1 ABC transporter permease subunit [Clostridium perfringens]NGT95630.1 ABC transporter permease subunit [Clostridium perfringens]